MNKVEAFEAEMEIFKSIENQLKSYIDNLDVKISDLTLIEDFIGNKEELEKIINSTEEECAAQATSALAKRNEMPLQVVLPRSISCFFDPFFQTLFLIMYVTD